MSETLSVKVRQTRGKRNARRLRRGGEVPAILYGHGEENVCLSLPEHDLSAAIRHGARVVDLRGDLNEPAFLREIQWDTFGAEILHADLTRVRAGEKVEAAIPVDMRGEAPGTKMGGIVQLAVHEVVIECPVRSLPEKLIANVNELELDGAITAAELEELPTGATLVTPPDTVVVQCVTPEPLEEELEAEEEVGVGPVEPEVIGKKEEDEEDQGS
jgi:large subunit ribosomal protein L25